MPAIAFRNHLLAIGALALAFIAVTGAVAGGLFHALDREVAAALAALWVPSLLILFQAIALLGGLELTGLLAVGIFSYLWRDGYRLGAFAAAAIPLATVLEVLYKRLLEEPGPPRSQTHPDGPSLTSLLDQGSTFASSFPSGHMTRTVVTWGLLAFIVYRLAARQSLRRFAILAAAAIISLMAFDRIYLEVHWESDVIGGLLLGGTILAVAITWLDWSAQHAA